MSDLEALLAEQRRRQSSAPPAPPAPPVDTLRELERLQAEQRRRREAQMVARPLPRAERAPTVFTPEQDVEREREAVLREEAARLVAERGVFLPSDASVVGAESRELERLRAEQERRRRRVVQSGVEEPVAVSLRGLPFFRPTRIREESARVVDDSGLSPLLPVEQDRELQRRAIAEADLPAPFEIDAVRQVPRRFYVDPSTGERSTPTLGQELTEAFALQTETSEERFREEERRRALQQSEIDRRIAAGEDVPFFESFVTGAPLGALTMDSQGSGVVETPFGAGLRSVLSWASAAAADGYFAGLGYEVDERGLPVDEDDFGYSVAEWRRARGIPDVVSSPQLAAAGADALASIAGLDDEARTTVENLFLAFPHVAFPTPGVASTRSTRKSTTYDPEGRRVVEDVEIPSLASDPAGFLREEARRIIQNVAKGRTIGDEYLDSPAVLDYYASVTGDPDDAYWGGLFVDVLVPGGTDYAKFVSGGLRGASRLAADAGVGVSSRARATRAVQAADDELRAARAAGAPDDQVDALARRARQLRDVREDYDPALLRRVASRAIARAVPEDARAPVLRALEAESPDTLERVLDTVNRSLPPADAAAVTSRVERLVERNLPGDFVLITDNIAVPRSLEQSSRAAVRDNRRALFVKPVARIADDLLDAAADAPPRVQDAAKSVFDDLRELVEGQSVALNGYSDIPKPLRRRLETVLRTLDEDVPRFDQARPRNFSAADTPLQRELATFESWSDVPADLRRQALAIADVRLASELGPRARLATDLTRLQLWFPSVGRRFAVDAGIVDRALDSRLASTPALRRLRASLRGPLETETLSAARAGREIDRAGRTVIRTLREKVLKAVERTGSVDGALDELLRLELRAAGESPRRAWEVSLGHLYGEGSRDAALAKLREDGVVDFANDFPTIASLKAVDRYLTSDASGFALGQPTRLLPDYQSSILKTLLEEGIRKQILASKKTTEATLRAASLERRFDDTASDLVTLADMDAASIADRASAFERELPAYLASDRGPRVAVYDRAASAVERELASSGEALFKMLDDVPVRQRADVAKMARDAASLIIGTGRRNLEQRVKYGYIVPNVIGQGVRLIQNAIVPLVTVGVVDTLRAGGRSVQRAVDQVSRRRVLGGGVRSPDGVYYSSETIDRLARDYGLGVRQLDTDRVGSLAADLLRDARKATRGTIPGAVADFANPLDKGLFLRLADGVERNFRRSVFEVELARGTPPASAAERAVESQLDYAAVPDVVQQYVGRYFGESAFLYKLGATAIESIVRNPGTAGRVLKTTRLRAEESDPYNIHGDKALLSLGIVDLGDDRSLYLPSTPIFRPVEAALGLLRQGDLMVDDLRFAAEQAQLIGEEATATSNGAGNLIFRSLSEVALPAVFEAFDRFTEGDAYATTGVPGVEPMSDEKIFWAAAMVANHSDPDRVAGGSWDTFTRFASPTVVEPPSEFSDARYPGVWTAQPPDGTPHILWGYSDDLDPLYYVFEPSDDGLRNIAVARALDPLDIERFLPVYAAATRPDSSSTERPRAIFTDGMIPDDPVEALLETAAPTTRSTRESERRRQAEQIRDVREDISIQ